MKNCPKRAKICLTVAALSIFTGCYKIPDFPEWNPLLVFPTLGQAIKCKLVDKSQDKLVLECEKTYTPIGEADLDGAICTKPKEQKAIINWVEDVRVLYKQNCRK